jgi:YD repeat-containing protein
MKHQNSVRGISALVIFIVVSISTTVAARTTEVYSFESDLQGWVNTGGEDWLRNANGTLSGYTGPSAAGSSSYYLYLETSSNAAYYSGDEATIESPTLGLDPAGVEFKYHMYGSDMGSLYLEVFENNQWIEVWSVSGQQQTSSAAAWLQANVILDEPANTSKIRFRGVAAGGYKGDMAIDHVFIRAAPGPIVGPSTATPGATFTLSWSEYVSVGSYDLERRVDGGSWEEIQSSTALSASQAVEAGSWDYRLRWCYSNFPCPPYSEIKTVVVAAAQSVTYTYDALGRLRAVTDSINSNRNYDYDPAGNRVAVSVGDAPPPPPNSGDPNCEMTVNYMGGPITAECPNLSWLTGWTEQDCIEYCATL